MHPYNPKLKQLSHDLRKNMTEAERLLWSKIRMKQLKGLLFSRQKPIGEYIADFYCHQANLVIEIDGGQHFLKDNMEYDKVRDEYMISMGIDVLRFTNSEVLTNIDGVIETILQHLS
ncbi:MAG: endonuclease domain-containing protein [Dehalococcoidales bacterium]|nr:endonuclease domain-containing protein [Dehalococcoidales bacterium]